MKQHGNMLFIHMVVQGQLLQAPGDGGAGGAGTAIHQNELCISIAVFQS